MSKDDNPLSKAQTVPSMHKVGPGEYHHADNPPPMKRTTTGRFAGDQSISGPPRSENERNQPSMLDLFQHMTAMRSESKQDIAELRREFRGAIKAVAGDLATFKSTTLTGPPARLSVPPPPVIEPPRDPMTSTGQHAIVVAQAGLRAAEANREAIAAQSVDYVRDQARAKAEFLEHAAAIAKDARAGFGKWVAIGGLLFAAISAGMGYLQKKDIAHDTAVEVKKEIAP